MPPTRDPRTLWSPLAERWALEPETVFLNHGSFGACPRAVLEHQTALRAQLEAQPLRFFLREAEPLLLEARKRLGAFLGADPEDLALVPNATTGINSVLRSLALAPGDELLVTDHEYNATRNALDYVADRAGAKVVVVALPFPLSGPDEVIEAVMAAVTPRTRLAVLDHITSPTGVVLPLDRLVPALSERGVDTLVDGAHAPGHIPLDLEALGAAYYTGNCHKWLCTPKGAAVLHVRRDRKEGLRPLCISHGANQDLASTGVSRFRAEFDWVGTADPTAWMCIPKAMDVLADTHEDGLTGVMAANHAKAVAARQVLADALSLDLTAQTPESMLGCLAALPLPPKPAEPDAAHGVTLHQRDPLQIWLSETWRIEVPIVPWPRAGERLVRVSAQRYNGDAQYEVLAEALREYFAA